MAIAVSIEKHSICTSNFRETDLLSAKNVDELTNVLSPLGYAATQNKKGVGAIYIN